MCEKSDVSEVNEAITKTDELSVDEMSCKLKHVLLDPAFKVFPP